MRHGFRWCRRSRRRWGSRGTVRWWGRAIEGRALCLRRAQPDLGGLAHQHLGELAGRRPQEPGQQDQGDAAGVRRSFTTRGRMYPQEEHKRVVLTIDNAPWHRGGPVKEALKEKPHL